MRASVHDQETFDGPAEEKTPPAFAWHPVSEPCDLPNGRHLLLWVDACPYTLNRPEIHMGHAVAGGRVRFLDPRINMDKNMQAAAWAEMPAGPGEASTRDAQSFFRWHDPADEPLPENVDVLIAESGGAHRIASMQENGYLFADNGDNLDPEDVVAWAYIPAAPETKTPEDEA